MNITVERGAGDKPYPESISDDLLVTEEAGRERGVAEINANDSDRRIITADGPKNFFMQPTSLVEIRHKGKTKRGIINMFARVYNKQGNNFTVTSSLEIEVKA